MDHFHNHFEQAPFSMQLLSPEGKTIAVNRAWKELWKIPEDIINNYILTDYLVAEDPQLKAKGIADIVRRGVAGEVVEIPAILYDPKDIGLPGDPKWVSGFMYPIKSKEGKIIEIVLTHQNVTATKVAEEELRRSRDQLQVIFEGVADGILVQDKNYRMIYANEAAARICGFSSGKELCESSIDVILQKFELRDEHGTHLSKEKLPARLALGGAGAQKGVILRVVNLSTRKEIWSEVSARPINDDDGRPYLAVSIFRDITEEKQHQERQQFLNQATKILSASLDYRETLNKIAMLAVPRLADWCSIDLLEDDGPHQVAVAHADPEMLKFAEELHQKYPPDWNAPTGSPNVIRTGVAEFYSHIPDELLETAAQSPEHYEIIKKLGLKSAMVVPLKLNEKVLGAITFVAAESGLTYTETDLEMAKELGNRAALALENAKLFYRVENLAGDLQNAVKARDEFISVCSHELKTPITSIKLQFQLAEKMLKSGDPKLYTPENQEKRITTTNRQLDRMIHLIDEMLDISRINTGKLEIEKKKVNLNELLSETLDRFGEQLETKQIPLKTELSADSIIVTGDRFRLEQVISNLMTNAIKYGSNKSITVRLRKEDSVVRMEVADSGEGIAAKDLERIFLRFERVTSDTNISGMGLGLYICKKIVDGHGGRIWAESSPGKGSTFVVEIPLH